MKHFIDFHTHHPSRQGELVIQQDVDSWGIHPWQADQSAPTEFPSDHPYLAIGECGLDKVCTTPFSLQMEVFLKHIQWSETLRKPLIIHCVKAIDEMLSLRRQSKATQPWILHGFRGKKQQMQSLLSHGFYISFGFHYNPQSLLSCPLESMLLETDDDPRPISLLYNQVAIELGISISNLSFQMENNYHTIFGA